jgi:uncharacterized membrane protein
MLGNRTTQLVAGVFVGVVAYSLIVLRSVRDGADDTAPGLPALATTVAIVLALGALGLLIFFVHHIGATIQVSTVTARIGRQTLGVVDDLYHDPFPGVSGRDGHAVVAAWRAEHDGAVVRPARSGFVQTVAYSDIAEALPKGGRASIGVYPGDFVTPLTEVVELWTDRELEGVVEDVSKALVVADERDLRSDVAFGIRQLVDIALRALSPGINDPTSAVTAIGHVQAVLERLAGRAYPAAEVHVEGRIVVRRVPGFDEHLALGFVEVARDAFDNPRVSCALLEALALVRRAAVGAGAHERAAMVSALATRIGEHAVAKSPTSHDADEVRRRLDAAVR